jgi:hypothetical protein
MDRRVLAASISVRGFLPIFFVLASKLGCLRLLWSEISGSQARGFSFAGRLLSSAHRRRLWRHAYKLEHAARILAKYLDQPECGLGRPPLPELPTLDRFLGNVQHPREDRLGHSAFDPKTHELLRTDCGRPIRYSERRGPENYFALRITDGFLQALADLLRHGETFGPVFHGRSSLNGSAGLLFENLDELTIGLSVISGKVVRLDTHLLIRQGSNPHTHLLIRLYELTGAGSFNKRQRMPANSLRLTTKTWLSSFARARLRLLDIREKRET